MNVKDMKEQETGSGKQKIQSRRDARKNSECCEQRAMIEVYKVQAVGMTQIFSKQRMAEKNISKIK